MEYILGNIFCWFQSFFGENLSDFLWGFDCSTGAFSSDNKFNLIGLIVISITLLIVVAYYYIINSPSFASFWSWLTMLGIASIINFFIGYLITRSALINGKIGDCLMYIKNQEGQVETQLISETNCIGFGVASIFVTIIFFIALSFLLKWWSDSAKHSPCF